MQLFFVANTDLKSSSTQMAFQRTIETGVDEWGFWGNFEKRGSGEYIITERGFKEAEGIFGDVKPRYVPTRAKDYSTVIEGVAGDARIKIVTIGKRSNIFVNEVLCKTAVEAYEIIDKKYNLDLPSVKPSAVTAIYDFAVGQGFTFTWNGSTLSARAV